MHPILFEVGKFTVYTYGFCIALGAVLGGLYMYWQGKNQFGWTFDQANTLFILFDCGRSGRRKVVCDFENPSYYLKNLKQLFLGVDLFLRIATNRHPHHVLVFQKNKIPMLAMLDVMAIVTCIVHGFGRIGCLMAGCCYGKPTLLFGDHIHTSTVPYWAEEHCFISDPINRGRFHFCSDDFIVDL